MKMILPSPAEPTPTASDASSRGFNVSTKKHTTVPAWIDINGGIYPAAKTIRKLSAGVYRPHESNMGVGLVPMRVITDHLVILEESQAFNLVNEFRKFWELRSKFKELGYLHKRGILLSGPPGAGKTCITAVFMREVIKDGGIVLVPPSIELGAAGITILRELDPNRPMVVVWEDIDKHVRANARSLTTLLNLLDGSEQIDGVFHIATTNELDTVPLTIRARPGRFDQVIPVPMPSPQLRRAFLTARAPAMDKETMESWVRATANMSLAHLRELVVGHFGFGYSLKDMVKRFAEMSASVETDRQSFEDFEGKSKIGF